MDKHEFITNLDKHYERNDLQQMASLLEDVIKYDVSRSGLWQYRKYFFALTDDITKSNLLLCTALALLHTISFDLKNADKYVELLKQMQKEHSKSSRTYKQIENQLIYLELALPQKSRKTLLKALKTLAFAMDKDKNTPYPSITAGRPSIANGGRDFTVYFKYVSAVQAPMRLFAKIIYGSGSVGMVDIAIAEGLYQRDKVNEALIQIVSIIPFIERDGDINVLFSAMYVQISIMLVSGQIKSARPMLELMEQKINAADADHLLPNLKALYVWGALYENDYSAISDWLENDAPNENADFCTLDRFRYTIKLRIYLIQEKHMLFLALVERLRPVIIAFDRKMEMCEIEMLYAMSLYVQNEKEKAFDTLQKALALGEKYNYARLFGDEGEKLYFFLRDYREQRGETTFLNKVIDLTRKLSLLYPDYLKSHKEQFPPLTQTETEVLRLMAVERTNNEIAYFMQISINTVKFHGKNIFSKLDVKNRQQAVKVAREVGII